jgi:hypothetical protein
VPADATRCLSRDHGVSFVAGRHEAAMKAVPPALRGALELRPPATTNETATPAR